MFISNSYAKDNSYVLKTGKEGAAILNLQHKYFSDKSIEQLEKAGLKEGQVVWDIGCGSGTMTEYIAKKVGPNGHVYAIDVSAEQLKVTKERLANFKNVTFIEGDITSLKDLPISEADIVYARLVVMHIKDAKPAIQNMKNLLKKVELLLFKNQP